MTEPPTESQLTAEEWLSAMKKVAAKWRKSLNKVVNERNALRQENRMLKRENERLNQVLEDSP